MTNVLTTPTKASVLTKEQLDQLIGMLRATVSLTSGPSDSRLQTVLELTVQGHGPSTIAQETGLSRTELIDAVKGIGQRFRTRKDETPNLYGTALFPLEPDPDVIAKLPAKRRAAALDEAARLRAENPLPYSWQLEFPEASIRKAVAAIRSKTEVDQNLKSLALRVAGSQVPASSGLLTFAAMRATWMLIQLGQLPRLVRDQELTLRAAETVTVAYDALESARADSVEAMRLLRSDPDPEDLDTLTVRARPLAEASVRRLEQIIAGTREHGDMRKFRLRGMNAFLNETSNLKMPTHVGELNEGQVHRVGLMLGLRTDPVPDRSLNAAEDRLTELGLGADVPWLKGIWISAFSCNREDDFWKAVENLVDGDTAWAQPLQ